MSLIGKIFGSHSDKELKRISGIVKKGAYTEEVRRMEESGNEADFS